MTQPVKQYKILLDNYTTNADKSVVINIGDAFHFHDQRDLITLRAETYMDEIFERENPTIDFEKFKFKPETALSGMSFYFYERSITTLTPISYNETLPPVWFLTDPIYEMSSGFNETDVPDSTLFKDSYFKFEFSLDPISQKVLFSVALPLDGTMLNPSEDPAPKIDFHQTVKTELENIFWLRKPQQIPGSLFTGNTFDLYCLITFVSSKTGKTTSFKRDTLLPNDIGFLSTHSVRDRYLLYRLNYADLTYKILDVDGGNILNNNRINLYSL
jgi:hypothetical protein